MNGHDIIEDRISKISSPGINPGLERVKRLLELTGDPQKSFRTINVAGTNGKGSVSSCIASILYFSGYRTALYTSPHLITFRERLLVNGSPLSHSKWQEAVEKVENTVKNDPVLSKDMPTYFENITAIALLMARKEKVDIAVLEAGMGGRLDATNHQDNVILSVITSIAEDHREFLGDTLEKIASEKFAIVPYGGKALFSGQPLSLNEQFIEECSVRNCECHILPLECKLNNVISGTSGSSFDFSFAGKDLFNLHVPLIGKYQIPNSSLAVASALILSEDMNNINVSSIRSGLSKVKWPGRMEQIHDDPPVIIDGAHNPAGMGALVESIRDLWSEQDLSRITVIYTSMKDKDYSESLKILSSFYSNIFCTEIPEYERSARSEEIKQVLSSFLPPDKIRTYGDPCEALKDAMDRGYPVLVCGSLYLVSYIKTVLAEQDVKDLLHFGLN